MDLRCQRWIWIPWFPVRMESSLMPSGLDVPGGRVYIRQARCQHWSWIRLQTKRLRNGTRLGYAVFAHTVFAINTSTRGDQFSSSLSGIRLALEVLDQGVNHAQGLNIFTLVSHLDRQPWKESYTTSHISQAIRYPSTSLLVFTTLSNSGTGTKACWEPSVFARVSNSQERVWSALYTI